MTDINTIDHVKKLAKKRGWSLRRVAEEAGIDINNIYRWDSKTPSIRSLNKVTKTLGAPTDYLLDEAGKKKTVDLADKDTVFTCEGREIPPEDLGYMKRLLCDDDK